MFANKLGFGALIPAAIAFYSVYALSIMSKRIFPASAVNTRTAEYEARFALIDAAARASNTDTTTNGVAVADPTISAAADRLEEAWAAERFAERWMRSMGVTDATVTRAHKDGGVDVESARFVVQVKNWKANVGAPSVQAIHGIAAASGRAAVVLARTGFTRDAIVFADAAGAALFTYDLRTDRVTPVSKHARGFMK